jgi:hypothetical protein
VDLPSLKNVYLVFHALLLEPYNSSRLILHLEAPTHNHLREFGDDVYEVEEILNRKQNEDDQWIYLIK